MLKLKVIHVKAYCVEILYIVVLLGSVRIVNRETFTISLNNI